MVDLLYRQANGSSDQGPVNISCVIRSNGQPHRIFQLWDPNPRWNSLHRDLRCRQCERAQLYLMDIGNIESHTGGKVLTFI